MLKGKSLTKKIQKFHQEEITTFLRGKNLYKKIQKFSFKKRCFAMKRYKLYKETKVQPKRNKGLCLEGKNLANENIKGWQVGSGLVVSW